MKIKIDTVPLEFGSTVLKVATKLSPETLLYWARNPDALTEKLQMPQFELMSTNNSKPYILPAIPETEGARLFKKNLLDPMMREEFNKIIPTLQAATPAIEVYSSTLNAPLFFDEIIALFGGEETLRESAFTYAQIVSIIARHKSLQRTKASEIITDKGSNNFPLIKKSGELIFVTAWSRHEYSASRPWKGWFKDAKNKHFTGNILIKQDVSDTILHS